MLYLISGFGFLSIVFLIIGLYNVIFKNRIILAKRIKEVMEINKKLKVGDELSKPFFDRVIKPILEKLAVVIGRIVPAKKRVSIHKKLMAAGNPRDITPNEYMVIQYATTIGLPILVLIAVLPLHWSTRGLLSAIIVGGIIGFFIPEYYLKMKAMARKEQIQGTLPDVLDLLTVSVEAGLGFDAAIGKVVEKIKGVLSQEFSRMLQEIKMGKPRKDSLRDLGLRCGTEDVQSFVGAIIQADQLGVSIGNVLRLQSQQMRQKRRQRAEQKAMKAPIKMLIPLIIFIFPTIFIVVLGPAALQVIGTF